MKIIAHTPRGTFESIDEPIPALDRAAVQANLTKTIGEARPLRMTTADGFIVLPGELVARSAFVVVNFNTPQTEGKL